MKIDLSELLDAALAGDRLALTRLLAGCQDRLITRIERKLPNALRSYVSPEDVLQEAYLDVFRRFNNLENRSLPGFLRWILTIADNQIIDCVRAFYAAKRGGGRESALHDSEASAAGLVEYLWATSHSPSRSAAGHESAQRILDALADLKPEYREAVRLRFIEGVPAHDVAIRMGRTEFSVHKLCSRGLARLRAALGDATLFFSGK